MKNYIITSIVSLIVGAIVPLGLLNFYNYSKLEARVNSLELNTSAIINVINGAQAQKKE